MKVYLVMSGPAYEESVDRVFSTLELAEDYIKGRKMWSPYIEEWDVDADTDRVGRVVWSRRLCGVGVRQMSWNEPCPKNDRGTHLFPLGLWECRFCGVEKPMEDRNLTGV